MDSGLVSVDIGGGVFNQLLSPAFTAPDAATTSQFLGSFGLSAGATQAATAAVMSNANPYAQQATMANGLLTPLGTPAATATAAGTAATAGAPAAAPSDLASHPALLQALAGMPGVTAAGATGVAAPTTTAFGFTPSATPAAAGGGAGAPATASPTGIAAVPPPTGAAGADPGAGGAAASGAPADPAAAGAGGGEYTVVSGDSLSKIAKKLGISDWRQLYDIPENKATIGDNPNVIKPGQKLKLPGGAAPAGAASGAAPGAGGPAAPAAAPAQLTAEQRTQKQTELTQVEAQIRTARTGLTDTYALVQPGSTPEQRAEAERKTTESQTQLNTLLQRQSALRAELGMPATDGVDWTTFGMPGAGGGQPAASMA